MQTASVPFKSKFQRWIYFFQMPTPLPLGLQRQILVFFCRPHCLHLGFKPSRIDLWGPEAAPRKERWRHLRMCGCRGSAVPWAARGQRLGLLPAVWPRLHHLILITTGRQSLFPGWLSSTWVFMSSWECSVWHPYLCSLLALRLGNST